MSDNIGYFCAFNYVKGREGAKFDGENLMSTFVSMGVAAEILDDKSYDDIRKKMLELSKKDFSKYLFVAIAFLAHGSEDGWVQIGKGRHDLIRIEKDILLPLCSNSTLNGKLKWLIMQTCQGLYDFMEDESEGEVKLNEFPLYYMKFYAATQGTSAYRDPGSGSIFISALCNELTNNFGEKHLEEIFSNASADTAERSRTYLKTKGRPPRVQRPARETNLGNKKFYLTRGLTN